ncbi:MFS transporter [Polymorphobacter megasporae]|uniref:MFS transporter n=1 Tax=Glacieibacterium megasporae TaxID=2835787 RepID=UPI001C1E25D9|nr:MFS transporter [Polymorphobacter megasporae]
MNEAAPLNRTQPTERSPVAGHVRWTIAALLFFATTINYLDRQVLGVLKPTLTTELHWSETDYADIVFWFQAAYAIGLLGFGRIIDRIGTRRGYAVAIGVWSVAAILHAGVRSAVGFAVVRFTLGLGEAGNFPAGIKTIAEWFPKRERALAAGLMNAGSNVGAVITPLLVPVLVLAFGWRSAFIVTGAIGFIWLAAWLMIYRVPREYKRLGAAELALIESDPPEPTAPVRWSALFRLRATWAFIVAKFLTDPIWYLFLFWLPDFFAKTYHLDLTTFGPPLVVIFVLADVGSIGGGWLSATLIKRGFSVNDGRKIALLVSAVLVIPVAFASGVSNLWLAVAILGLAAAAHQGWSSNLYALVTDTVPKSAVASVIGIGSAAGAVGGMIMAKSVGAILESIGSYQPIFIWASSIYLVALLIVHLLLPRLRVIAPD